MRIILATFLMVMFIHPVMVNAQEQKIAKIELTYTVEDSINKCTATVTCDGLPVKEVDVHFYVKRLYSNLPIGSVKATDETGKVTVDFPSDLPGDKNQMLQVIAQLEDDEVYGNSKVNSEVKWGKKIEVVPDLWDSRSLSASREKAPLFLIIVSNIIITGIWGTIFYVIYQVFRIKKERKQVK